MKTRHLLTSLASVALALLATGCSDYDNGFTDKELQFIKDFKAEFGEIDSQQDWNLAERTKVTVTTSRTSNVKIYALMGGEYCIVGDYHDVQGQRELGIDILEGVTQLLVSDGTTTMQTMPGGSVDFSGAGIKTRTVYEGNDVVKVRTITDVNGYEIDGITYPKYLYATPAETEALKGVVPEIGHRDNYTNLNRVTHDFQYVSTGEFVIYPYYYQTSAYNTLGIYYYDENGVRQMVDIYKSKEGSELQYEDNTYAEKERVFTENMADYGTSTWSNLKSPAPWVIDNGTTIGNFHVNGWSTEGKTDGSNMLTPFIEYWRGTGNNLENGTISRTFRGMEPGTYGVWIDARAYNEGSSTAPTGIKFFANETSLDFCSEGTNATNGNSALVYYKDLYVRCTVGADGVLNVGFTLNNVTSDWLSFKNLRIDKLGDWNDALKNGKSAVRRGQGIIVNIPVGTPFGMYLTTKNSRGNATFYSQSELNNNPNVCGYGVTDDGQGNVTLDQNLKPCYASTFHVGNQMYLGFEDWTNVADESDFDLNDLVLAFSGSTPTIINEDPTPAGTWLIACEDLGGSFDSDYNDVVFKVEHISGQTFASITPLAAGGKLASYLFFEDPTSNASEVCFGEIHQLFGAEPARSREYTQINCYSRGMAGQSKTFTVSENWTLAHYTSDDFDINSQYSKNGKEVNMGGFGIRVLPDGAEPLTGNIYSTNPAFGGASIIAAPGLGDAPMMICLPYTYTQGDYTYVWAWPKEMLTIATGIGNGGGSGAYPQFAAWIGDHTQNPDWYKYPNGNTVDELKWKSENAEQAEKVKTTGGFMNAWGQVVKAHNLQYINKWGTDFSDHTVDMFVHEEIQFEVKLADDATGNITIPAFNAGTTGATYTWDGKKIYISGVKKPGTIMLTLQYSGDAKYDEDDINYIFNVTDCSYARFITTDENGTKYTLTWDDGLKLAKYGWQDVDKYWENTYSKQEWALEPSSVEGFYYMYNLKAAKYLVMGDNGSPASLQSNIPDYRGRFTLDSEGRLHRDGGATRFFGNSDGQAPAEGLTVTPGLGNKSTHKIYTWTTEALTF